MPRRGENIYKRKDGRWEGRYIKSRSVNGKAIYGYVYAQTYKEVKERLAQKLSMQNDPLASAPDNTECFKSVATEWFESVKAQVKESTSNKYWNSLNSYVLPEFGEKKLQEITYDFINERCNHLLKCGGKKGKGFHPKLFPTSYLCSAIFCNTLRNKEKNCPAMHTLSILSDI